MEPRVDFKDIELSGRKWRIKKFNAMTGSYIAFKIVGILTPLLSSVKNVKDMADINLEDINFTEIAASLTSLPESDFNYIQTQCLKICFELLPGNMPPVLDQNGNFGCLDLENDTGTVLGLTVQALVFNVSGFFGESLLTMFKGKLDTFLQGAKT